MRRTDTAADIRQAVARLKLLRGPSKSRCADVEARTQSFLQSLINVVCCADMPGLVLFADHHDIGLTGKFGQSRRRAVTTGAPEYPAMQLGFLQQCCDTVLLRRQQFGLQNIEALRRMRRHHDMVGTYAVRCRPCHALVDIDFHDRRIFKNPALRTTDGGRQFAHIQKRIELRLMAHHHRFLDWIRQRQIIDQFRIQSRNARRMVFMRNPVVLRSAAFRRIQRPWLA